MPKLPLSPQATFFMGDATMSLLHVFGAISDNPDSAGAKRGL